MNSKILHFILVFILVAALALFGSSDSLAHQSEKSSASIQLQQSQVISFADLGLEDLVMFGPYSSDQFEFGVPSNWSFYQSGELVLKLKPQFLGADVPLFFPSSDGFLALLTVTYNDHRIYEVGINPGSPTEISIPIPLADLNNFQQDGRNKVEFSFASELSCDYDILASLIIEKTSYLELPYEILPPDLDLRAFPRPMYQRSSIINDAVALVFPDNPTPGELEAMMTVSASLGSITRGNLPLEYFTISEISQATIPNHHMVVVGTSDSVSSLNQFGFDLPISNSAITTPGFTQNDGILDLSYSPWDPTKAVLFVGGDSEEGTLKASQTLGTGTLFVFGDPTFTIVDQVDPFAGESSLSVSQTLKNLGYSSSVRGGPNHVSGIGSRTLDYDVYVSPSQINAEDGSFIVEFFHSGAMKLGISAMTVLVNNNPIGSVPLTEETAKGINVANFSIPNEFLHIGSNRFSIKVDLVPETQCHVNVSANLWFAVDDSSLIQLPVAELTTVDDNRTFDLQAFPETMLTDPSLANLLLIVPDSDPNAWKAAAKLYTYLGDKARAPIFIPNVETVGEVSQEILNRSDVILIGLPMDLPIVEDLNPFSSIKFDTNTNQAILDGFRVLYRTPEDANLGYIQLLISPWNPNRVFVSILGNSNSGLLTAVNALANPDFQESIVGNVTLTTIDAVLSADTRIGQSSADIIRTLQPTILVETPVATLTVPTDFPPVDGFTRPNWLVPVLLVNLGLLLIIIIVVVVVTSRRRVNNSGPMKSVNEKQDDFDR